MVDRCAGQYKNKNNFINLCHHEDDFALAAEWNFFATSLWKSTCDGIGGTVKRLVTKASLQRPYNDQILTSDAIINFCNENMHGIKFFNVPPEDVARSETELKVRLERARTVKGTLQLHRFIPVSQSRLHMYRLSAQANDPELVSVSERDGVDIGNEAARSLHLQEQSFVCCLYDNLPWIGMVDEISDELHASTWASKNVSLAIEKGSMLDSKRWHSVLS